MNDSLPSSFLFGLEPGDYAKLTAGSRFSLMEGRYIGVLRLEADQIWCCGSGCHTYGHLSPGTATKCAAVEKGRRLRAFKRWQRLRAAEEEIA